MFRGCSGRIPLHRCGLWGSAAAVCQLLCSGRRGRTFLGVQEWAGNESVQVIPLLLPYAMPFICPALPVLCPHSWLLQGPDRAVDLAEHRRLAGRGQRWAVRRPLHRRFGLRAACSERRRCGRRRRQQQRRLWRDRRRRRPLHWRRGSTAAAPACQELPHLRSGDWHGTRGSGGSPAPAPPGSMASLRERLP